MKIEILQEFTASNDQIIVKGKRTKRLRPSSSASSSAGGGAVFNCNSSVSCSTTSTTSTEEDEDMANCLILLARGDEIKPPSPENNKFRSRKFTEMATTTNGKVGIYVYECKTCSRTFASFQALGGHRASHKKPKVAADIDHPKSPLPPVAPPRDEGEEGEEERGKFDKLNAIAIAIAPSTSTVTQLPSHVEIKSKIHECSICGSEFSSGQALGGHMRRHRSTISGATAKIGGENSNSPSRDQKSRSMLTLDLNLPAPAEDEFHQFSSSNQQRRLVFSAAALVDCHY